MSSQSGDFHIVILAAGASTRLGSPKQLARVRGRPALQRVVQAATSVAGQAVTVVLGAHAVGIMPMLTRAGVTALVNRRWEEGLGSSIRTGIAALPATCEAVLLLLGDQVEVTPQDLRRLVDAWKGREGVIAAALYRRQAGVPAIFPRWLFSELSELRGDRGAKSVLQRHASRLVHVPMPNAAVDLDTPEDLVRLNTPSEPTAMAADADEADFGSTTVVAVDWAAETWLAPSGLILEDDAGEPHAAHHRPQ